MSSWIPPQQLKQLYLGRPATVGWVNVKKVDRSLSLTKILKAIFNVLFNNKKRLEDYPKFGSDL